MSEDPFPNFATLATGAVAMHEMFTAYVDAGFSEDQAITLLTRLIVEQQRAQQ